MSKPTYSLYCCESRCRRLLCPFLNLCVGDMMEPFHSLDPPEGSDIEAVQPVHQGVVQGPGFSPIQEGRNNRCIVYLELCLYGDISVAPQRSPERSQDGGYGGSASVYWSLVLDTVGLRYLKVGTNGPEYH